MLALEQLFPPIQSASISTAQRYVPNHGRRQSPNQHHQPRSQLKILIPDIKRGYKSQSKSDSVPYNAFEIPDALLGVLPQLILGI